MTLPTPDDNHRWLHQLVGEWEYEMDSPEPGKKITARERVRKLGDLWVVGESDMPMLDGSVGQAVITLGYDQRTKRFVGTWVGAMMTHMWVYDGQLDAARRVLTLDCVGPRFDEKGTPSASATSRYRDAIELHADGRRTLDASVLGDDGAWKTFMTAHYRRTA